MYDGFENFLSLTVTKSSASTLSMNVDPSANRITTGDFGYDAVYRGLHCIAVMLRYRTN